MRMPIAFRLFCQSSSNSRSRARRRRCHGQHQRLAVGLLATAVAVAVEHSRTCRAARSPPAASYSTPTFQLVVVSGQVGRNRLRRRNRLALVDDADQLPAVLKPIAIARRKRDADPCRSRRSPDPPC